MPFVTKWKEKRQTKKVKKCMKEETEDHVKKKVIVWTPDGHKVMIIWKKKTQAFKKMRQKLVNLERMLQTLLERTSENGKIGVDAFNYPPLNCMLTNCNISHMQISGSGGKNSMTFQDQKETMHDSSECDAQARHQQLSRKNGEPCSSPLDTMRATENFHSAHQRVSPESLTERGFPLCHDSDSDSGLSDVDEFYDDEFLYDSDQLVTDGFDDNGFYTGNTAERSVDSPDKIVHAVDSGSSVLVDKSVCNTDKIVHTAGYGSNATSFVGADTSSINDIDDGGSAHEFCAFESFRGQTDFVLERVKSPLPAVYQGTSHREVPHVYRSFGYSGEMNQQKFEVEHNDALTIQTAFPFKSEEPESSRLGDFARKYPVLDRPFQTLIQNSNVRGAFLSPWKYEVPVTISSSNSFESHIVNSQTEDFPVADPPRDQEHNKKVKKDNNDGCLQSFFPTVGAGKGSEKKDLWEKAAHNRNEEESDGFSSAARRTGSSLPLTLLTPRTPDVARAPVRLEGFNLVSHFSHGTPASSSLGSGEHPAFLHRFDGGKANKKSKTSERSKTPCSPKKQRSSGLTNSGLECQVKHFAFEQRSLASHVPSDGEELVHPRIAQKKAA